MAAEALAIDWRCCRCGSRAKEAHIWNDVAKAFVCHQCDAELNMIELNLSDDDELLVAQGAQIVAVRTGLHPNIALNIALDLFSFYVRKN